jgi:hypothetical protein
MTTSIDGFKSRHLPKDWLSISPKSFNGLGWAAGIGLIGEPTVRSAREGRRLALSDLIANQQHPDQELIASSFVLWAKSPISLRRP